ncbi:MAG: endo-1,4-beta-xylanase [Sedimentisphaeraceae bacterium JB056]
MSFIRIFVLSLFVCGLVTAEQTKRNLVRNGSFEAGGYGWMFDAKPLDGEFMVTGDGDASVKIGEKCQKVSLASEWFKLASGKDYFLTLKLRSQNDNMPVRISVWSWADAGGKWNQKTESAQTVNVKKQWEQFSLKVNIEPARMDKYQVAIETWTKGEFYVDDVCLVEGGQTTQHPLPFSDVEMGLESSNDSCMFDVTDLPQADLYFYNYQNMPVDAKVEIKLTDIYDENVVTKSETINIKPGLKKHMPLTLPVTEKGYYKLTANLTFPGGSQRCNFAFAVIDVNRSRPKDEGYFGVCTSSHNLQRQLKRAAAIGINNFRVHESLNWKNIEPEQGKYVWPDSAGYEAYSNKGFNILVYFDGIWQGQPDWAKGLDEKEKLKRYGIFCARAVEHYKGIIEDFEVINEPWGHIGAEEYYDILRAVYPKAKAANPDANMAAVTGYHGPQIDFMKKTMTNGSLDYMDVYTLHPYPRPMQPEPVLVNILQEASGWLDQQGWDKPVWITEMGWTTSGGELLPTRIPRPAARNNTELERAMYIVRANIISIANGVDRIYWFFYSGDNNFYYSYDMFECDSNDSVMKTVPVYSAMTSRLRDYKFEKTLSEGEDDVYAYMFVKGDDRQVVAFCQDEKDAKLYLENITGDFAVYDMLGNQMDSAEVVNQKYDTPLSGKVIYIEMKNAAAEPKVVKQGLVCDDKLSFSEPLPKMDSDIIVPASGYSKANFSPDPLWRPGSLRTYSGDDVLLKRTYLNDEKVYMIEYRFDSEKSGLYDLVFVCSLFETDDNLSWSVNGSQFVSNASSQLMGKSWVYSNNPNIWWRFKCGAHNMGKARLKEGTNTLRVKLQKPLKNDYGYFMFDVASFFEQASLEIFEDNLGKLE